MNINNIDIKYLITALADNEITDENARRDILARINSDKNLRYEYHIQQSMKSLIGKIKVQPLPEKVKLRVIRRIKPVPWFPSYRSRAFLAYGTAAIILIALTLILFNRAPVTPALETGSSDMLTEAVSNFNKINNGELKLQIESSDPEILNDFFNRNGVKYSAVVPVFDDLTLLGGLVSTGNGEKLAHHVYKGYGNNLVYVFQADQSYLKNGAVLNLPSAIIKELQKDHCYSSVEGRTKERMQREENQYNYVITVIGQNIFTVISGLPVEEIEAHFCTQL